ncbi:MAG: cupin-like domain-containing protein [Alphaproteobacteria bacterium]|nr:cupin-like domain-containing protein [Alphaproteobacteria bacterium]
MATIDAETGSGTEPLAIEERTTLPTAEEFRREYVARSRPLVIRGGIRDWPAFRDWTPEFLAGKVGENEVNVQQSPTGIFGLDPEKGGPRYQEISTTLGEYVWTMMDAEDDGIRYYVQRVNIPDRLPELMEDFAVPDYVDASKVYLINLWLGPAGNVTTLHYDTPNNFLAQVRGRKRLKMFSPWQARRLYPCRSKAYNMSQVNIEAPDLDRFPRFKDVTMHEVEIEEGDLLFIPTYWWHQVYSLTAGISVNIWWIPLWRQLIGPQLWDNVPDIARELMNRAGPR